MRFEFRDLEQDEALVGVEKCGNASFLSILPIRGQTELIAQDIERRGGRMEFMPIADTRVLLLCSGCEVCGVHARIGTPPSIGPAK